MPQLQNKESSGSRKISFSRGTDEHVDSGGAPENHSSGWIVSLQEKNLCDITKPAMHKNFSAHCDICKRKLHTVEFCSREREAG